MYCKFRACGLIRKDHVVISENDNKLLITIFCLEFPFSFYFHNKNTLLPEVYYIYRIRIHKNCAMIL